MKRINKFFQFFLIIFIALPNAMNAQPGPPDMPPPSPQRIEQYKKVRLLEVLNLDEEKSARFLTRYDKFTKETYDLMKKQRDLVDELDKKLKNNASDQELSATIEDILNCNEKIAETRTKYFHGLNDILTNRQIAEYMVFEREFARNIREVMHDLARDKRGEKEKH
jgi:hypothetical protein